MGEATVEAAGAIFVCGGHCSQNPTGGVALGDGVGLRWGRVYRRVLVRLNKTTTRSVLSKLQLREREREREMFYLTTHSTHFIYGYMASDIWSRTILIVKKETRWRHIGYSFRLTARVLLYAPSHRQDNTNHGLCYTSRGAMAGTRNSSMDPPHEGSIRRPMREVICTRNEK